jgi:hypothetical protein
MEDFMKSVCAQQLRQNYCPPRATPTWLARVLRWL